jgi:hypothetical protein
MHLELDPSPAAPVGSGIGFSLLGLAGAASATVAVLLMWTLLTAPTQVAVAVAQGPAELAGVLLQALVDAMRQLLSWL